MSGNDLKEDAKILFGMLNNNITGEHIKVVKPNIIRLMEAEKIFNDEDIWLINCPISKYIDYLGNHTIDCAIDGDKSAMTEYANLGYDFGRCFARIIHNANESVYDHLIQLGMKDGLIEDDFFVTRLSMLIYHINDDDIELSNIRAKLFYKLLHSGADVTGNGTNKPLLLAATRGLPNIVLALIEAGAIPTPEIIKMTVEFGDILKEARDPYGDVMDSANLMENALLDSDILPAP